jgi:hypothetical protein
MITMIGNDVSMSQMRHSEVSAQRNLNSGTTIEIAVYQDYFRGPGLPLMVTAITPLSRQSRVMEMNEDHSSQRGMRATVKHKWSDFITGSIAYIYGESKEISGDSRLLSSALLEINPENFLHQRYQHSLTSRFDVAVPITRTNLVATIRWNSGDPLTALDWFSDRMDFGTKSVNFEMRQTLPMPEFFGPVGRWEFMLDVRNALNQGREVLSTANGALVLTRNPRSIRFGLNYSFQ